MIQKTFVGLTAAILCSAFAQFGNAYQDETPAVPPTPGYEEEIPEKVDPLKGEPVAATRIQEDAGRLAELGGEGLGEDFSELYATLFDGTKPDAARLKAADDLEARIPGLNPKDPAHRSASSQLSRRVRLVKAGVGGLYDGPTPADSRDVMNEFLVRTAIDFESSAREAYAARSRHLYVSLKQNHPSLYERIKPVVAADYFNYNLHFVFSEPMLSMLVSDYRTQRGSVADCILGAWVTGCQCTDTAVSLDIKPSSGQAAFNMIVDGRTMSDTQGRKSPATVYTKGSHGFRIEKMVYFDGKYISANNGNIHVNANNRTVGVRTDYDRIPIIGGIARSIAFRKAQELKGQSEAIAARKLADQALPRFESEVSSKFDKANTNLENNFRADLEERGIAPESYSARSSETHLAMSTRTISPTTLSASTPPESKASRRGLTIQAHESIFNSAFSSLGLGGPTTSEELITTIEEALQDLSDSDRKLRRPQDKEKITDFDFEEEDAIRVRFDEGKIVLLFRTGFYQYNRGEERPAEPTLDKQVFEIPIDIKLEDGQLVLTPPPVDNPQKFGSMIKQRPADSTQKGVSMLRRALQARKIALQIVSTVFANQDDPSVVDMEKRVPAEVQVPMGDGSKLKLRVTSFKVTDGWLTAVMHK